MQALAVERQPDLIDMLLGEHALILSVLRQVEPRIAEMNLSGIKQAALVIESMLMAHAMEEDSLLFHGFRFDQASVREAQHAMDTDHQNLRQCMSELRAAKALPVAQSLLRQAIELTREHFAVEERVLFNCARDAVGARKLKQLGAMYARKRGLAAQL